MRLCSHDAQALRGFRSDSSFALIAWLRSVAVSVVIDCQRSEFAQRSSPGKPFASIGDVEAILPAADDTFRATERSLLRARIHRCLQSEKERDRSVFWLYYRQGLTAKNIASIAAIGLGIKGVESTILRMTRAVRECVTRKNVTEITPIVEGNRL